MNSVRENKNEFSPRWQEKISEKFSFIAAWIVGLP